MQYLNITLTVFIPVESAALHTANRHYNVD